MTRTQKTTKIDTVRQMLATEAGASLTEISNATGWQVHSVRAALSGLRKTGVMIERSPAKDPGGAAIYRIAATPAVTA